MTTDFDATYQFMVAAKQTRAPGFPADFCDPLRVLRRDLLWEEFGELEKAEQTNNAVEVADGLADLIVVAKGSLYTYFSFECAQAIMVEVDKSNMSKVVDGQIMKRADGKLMKGPNYVAPDIRKILKEFGVL